MSAISIIRPQVVTASTGDISMSPSTVSADSGGYVVLTALNGKQFDSNTTITVTYGSNSIVVDSKDINVAPDKILVKVPEASGYTGDAYLVVKASSAGFISDIVRFKYIAGPVISTDPVITNIYQNVETTFVRDANGRIIGNNKVLQTVVEGKNFDLKEVKIGSLSSIKRDSNGDPEVQLLYADSEKIVVKTPVNVMSGDVKDITVINNDGGQDTKSFKYNVTPYIYYLDKSKAYPGQQVTITGDNFENIQMIAISNTRLSADSYTVKNGQTVVFTVPVGMDPGVKDIVISQAGSTDYEGGEADFGGTRVTLKGEFAVIQTPPGLSITKVEPNAGPVSGGTVVTITGSGFVDSLQVFVGEADMLDQYLKDGSNKHLAQKLPLLPGQDAYSTVRVQIPQLPSGENPGPKDIILYNPLDGTSYSYAGGFTYLTVGNQLTISTVYPMEMRETTGSRTVNVQGRNIKNFNVDKFTVTGSVYTSYDNNTDEYIVKAIGRYYDNDNVSIEKRIKLNIGNNAVITGIDGDDNGVQTITAEMPPFTLDPRQDTPADVILTTHTIIQDDQGKKLLDLTEQYVKSGFMLKPDLTQPRITEITPPVGSREGGYAVTIKGYDIRDGAKVYFGSIQAQVKSIDAVLDDVYKIIRSTVVVVVPPSKSIGKVPVKIVNTEGGTSDTTDPACIFTYQTAPKISSITPSVGEAGKAVYVTIKGSEFYVVPNDTPYGRMPRVRVHYREYNPDGTVASDVYSDYTPICVTDDSGNVVDGRGTSFGTQLQVAISSDAVGYHDIEVINPDYDESYRDVSTGAHVIAADAFIFKKPDKEMTIDSVTPSKGPIEGGTAVTIKGANFGLRLMVTIDGKPATGITRLDQGQIKAVTPPGTPGLKPVQVVDLDTGATVTYYDAGKGQGFEYVRVETSPAIDEMAPDHGTAGTWVYIRGKDFVKEAKDSNGNIILPQSVVRVGDVTVPQGDVYVVDNSLIKFKMPQMPEPVAYDVAVENPDGSIAYSPVKFQYLTPSQDTLPDIQDVIPPIGPVSGGNIAVIKGKNFKDGVEVYFNGEKAQISDFDFSRVDADGLQSISVIVPPSKQGAGDADVMVVNYDGGNDTWEYKYKYAVPDSNPVITSISPNKGSTMGGDVVTVKGRDFRRVAVDVNGSTVYHAPDVYFGGVKADKVAYIDEYTLEVTTPAYPAAKSVDVTLVNPASGDKGGGVAVLKGGYTYTQSKPTISDIIPQVISVKGDTVIIKGSNFTMRRTGSDGKTIMSVVKVHDGADVIKLPSNPDDPNDNSVTVLDASTIVVTIPPLKSQGNKVIEVVNPDGGTATGTVKAVAPLSDPVISSVTPVSGSVNGGTRVTIYGRDLRKTAKVYFGGRQATIIQHADDDTYLVVFSPQVPQDYADKWVDIMVDNGDGGSAYMPNAFKYLATASNPVVSKVAPDSGSTNGGDRVIVYGSGFQMGATVYFDGVEASNPQVMDDNTAISVITPPGREGWVDVTVRNPDGSEATLKNGYEYIVTNPETPKNFSAKAQSGTTVKLWWDKVKGALKYELYLKNGNNTQSQWIFITSLDASVTTYYVRGLSPGTTYSFRLRAINASGVSGEETCRVKTYGMEDEEQDENQSKSYSNSIMVSGNKVIVTLGIKGSTAVDLTGSMYKGINKYVLNIPWGLKGQNKSFDVRFSGGDISFNTSNIGKKIGSPQVDADYVVLEINRMGGDVKERASIAMGKGYKLVSDVYDVNIYVQKGSEKYVDDGVVMNYSMALDYDPLIDIRSVQMYYYNPGLDRWLKTTGYVQWDSVIISRSETGRFALFSEVKR